MWPAADGPACTLTAGGQLEELLTKFYGTSTGEGELKSSMSLPATFRQRREKRKGHSIRGKGKVLNLHRSEHNTLYYCMVWMKMKSGFTTYFIPLTNAAFQTNWNSGLDSAPYLLPEKVLWNGEAGAPIGQLGPTSRAPEFTKKRVLWCQTTWQPPYGQPK